MKRREGTDDKECEIENPDHGVNGNEVWRDGIGAFWGRGELQDEVGLWIRMRWFHGIIKRGGFFSWNYRGITSSRNHRKIISSWGRRMRILLPMKS